MKSTKTSALDQHPRPEDQEARQTLRTAASAAVDQHPRPDTPSPDVVVPDTFAEIVTKSDRIATRAVTAATAITLNAEEQKYLKNGNPTFIGNFHKGMPHNEFGEVDPAAYQAFLTAVNPPHDPADFEAIPLGSGRPLTSPQAGLAEDTQGPKPSQLTIPAPPSLDSAAEAAEAADLYWMALLRDVPFTHFDTDPMVADAIEDLNTFSGLNAVYPGGRLSPQILFRGNTPGERLGPWTSQFLLRDIPYGSLTIPAKQRTVMTGRNYLTRFDEWLAVQNGKKGPFQDDFDGTRRYIRSMRDIGQYVHVDALYEAYLNACLILLSMNAPLDPGNPYSTYTKQAGFATFGGPHILSLVCEVATRALKAVWYQKWIVWRRLRPEAYGGLVHLKMSGIKPDYPIHADLINSDVVEQVHAQYGTYLLPMAFPEGSPTHPAYGAGHATVAGACVTILKAWFDEGASFPNPMQPTADGLELVPYVGPDTLTIGGELNKVAANIAIGRNMAGVHWYSDYASSVRLGEQVAICILKQQSADYNEKPNSCTLTTFDNVAIRIQEGKVFRVSDGVEIYKNCHNQ